MRVFHAVETGSFSGRRVLGTTPSTVSKLISRDRARLGVRLVERSTPATVADHRGPVYYERSVAAGNDPDLDRAELS